MNKRNPTYNTLFTEDFYRKPNVTQPYSYRVTELIRGAKTHPIDVREIRPPDDLPPPNPNPMASEKARGHSRLLKKQKGRSPSNCFQK